MGIYVTLVKQVVCFAAAKTARSFANHVSHFAGKCKISA